MTRRRRMGSLTRITIASLLALLAVATAAHAQIVRIALTGYEEVPAISTSSNGEFEATINDSQITWELTDSALEGGAVQQAHIHFAQASLNGAIAVFLCTNLGNGPAGTQACPAGPATITGTIVPTDVTNLAGAQGLAAGELAELVAAIRAKAAYVNVHSATFPAGEIRGQLPRNPGALGDDDEN